jgi:RND family efflux transporter MFP subunit
VARVGFLNFSAARRRRLTRDSGLVVILPVLILGGLPLMGQSQGAACVTARMDTVTPHLEAYGQIEPSATLTISFAEPGVVAGLQVLPSAAIRAGEVLAHLNGPEVQAVLSEGQADVRRARVRLSAAQTALAIKRQRQAPHSSDPQAYQAERALIRAKLSFDNAQSHLQAVRQMMSLRSPVDATVLMTNATNGELVSAGQPILMLQTPYQLWLDATYYGSDLSVIRAGMTGTFSPADGSESVPVRVCAVYGLLTAGGGESITLVPANPGSRWIDGEFGKVTLNLPPRMLVAVPTRALILDQGKWWVLVRTADGDRAQAVVPGPSRGWETFVERGLDPGAQVVVENAYLLFHRNISQRYQPPD